MNICRLLFLLLIFHPLVLSADILGWRGDGSGRFANAKAPVRLDDKSSVLWQTQMANWSNSSPTIVGKRLFILSEKYILVCMNTETGKVEWSADHDYTKVVPAEQLSNKGNQEEIAKLTNERDLLKKEMRRLWKKSKKDPKYRKDHQATNRKHQAIQAQINQLNPFLDPIAHRDNGYTSTIPVTDGKTVYALFGNGVACAYSLDGKKKWARFIEKAKDRWGHSTSPIIAGGKLIVHMEKLRGLDASSGKELWAVDARKSWGSPLLLKERFLVHPNGAIYDIHSGKVTLQTKAKLTYAAPVIVGDIIYYIENNAKALRYKIEGDKVSVERIWRTKVKGSRHYASSLVHQGLIYALSREEILTVLDAKTGEEIYQKRLNFSSQTNSVYSSVTLGGNHIYLGTVGGDLLIIKPGREYKEVRRMSLDGFRSSPVFAGDRMYLRTFKYMTCYVHRGS